MRGKKVIVIILSFLIFLSVAILGVSTVYRVEEVTVIAPVVSDEAKGEASDLQTRLNEVYAKKSILFTDRALADGVLADFPYFRITSFKKDYPNRIILTVSEDEEVYAVRNGEEYYILNGSGVLLGIRDNYFNRSDKTKNLLIFGNNLQVNGAKGELLTSDVAFQSLFSLCGRLNQKLLALPVDGDARGIRGNVLSIEVQRPTLTAEETVFKLTMVEGVSIYVRNPDNAPTDFADKAIDAYLSLSDLQKTMGALLVWQGADGVQTHYSKDAQPIA